MDQHQQEEASSRKFYIFLAAVMALIILPTFAKALSSFAITIFASLVLGLLLLLWALRDRISKAVFPWVMVGAVFLGFNLIGNASRIEHPRHVWQFLTFSDHTPWTSGHTLAAMCSGIVGMLLWKPWKRDHLKDKEEILSGPALISMEEARERIAPLVGPGQQTITWAGLSLPDYCGTEHFVIVGAPQSGKSLSFRLLMKSVLPTIGIGLNRRAVIYDAKRDTSKLLSGLFPDPASRPEIFLMNPFDERSAPWAMNRDIREGATAHQIASILMPEPKNDHNSFFTKGSRALLGGVMEAFAHIAPETWTLRDVILTMQNSKRIAAVLAACEDTRYLIDKFVTGQKRDSDIEATIETELRGLRFVAAAWFHSNRPPISLAEWIKTESILVLGVDPSQDAVIQALNRAMFKRMVEMLRKLPDKPTGDPSQTWFFIDELRNAGQLHDLDKLLVEGRSKGACVVLGFQDIPGLREVFGQQSADEIIGVCANKVFLHNGEQTTVKYASDHFKVQEVLETKVSRSHNASSDGKPENSQSASVSTQKITRPVVHEGKLKCLGKPTIGRQGLEGYCDTAIVGTNSPYFMSLPHSYLDQNLPPMGREEGGFERGPAQMKLPDWTIEDLSRLNLGGLPGLLAAKPTDSKPAPEDPGGSFLDDI